MIYDVQFCQMHQKSFSSGNNDALLGKVLIG